MHQHGTDEINSKTALTMTGEENWQLSTNTRIIDQSSQIWWRIWKKMVLSHRRDNNVKAQKRTNHRRCAANAECTSPSGMIRHTNCRKWYLPDVNRRHHQPHQNWPGQPNYLRIKKRWYRPILWRLSKAKYCNRRESYPRYRVDKRIDSLGEACIF